MKRLLTIQDISCVGQCSTTVALPLVSACGVECAVLPPAILSNHTAKGFSGWTFRDLTDEMKPIEARWITEGVKFDAFYTGYVCESHIEPILSLERTCAKPGALRFVDPAMADGGMLYAGFAADFPTKMARLVKGCDYVLPNLTEAALLTGMDAKAALALSASAAPWTEKAAFYEKLIAALHALGAKNVILTGVERGEELGSAVSDGVKTEYDFNPKLARMSHGTGDVYASVFAGAVLRGLSALDAAALAVDIVCEAIAATEPDHWYGVSFERTIPRLANSFSNHNHN